MCQLFASGAQSIEASYVRVSKKLLPTPIPVPQFPATLRKLTESNPEQVCKVDERPHIFK